MKTKLSSVILILSFFLAYESADAQGPDIIWAKSVGEQYDEFCWSMAVDRLGNVYSTGYFEGTVDFDPGPANYFLTSTGQRDIFILKLDADGNFLWARAMGDSINDDIAWSIATDDIGNVYTTGRFQSTVDFDPGPGVFHLSTSYAATFISKLDSSGNFVWAKAIDKSWGNAIHVDEKRNVYVSGNFGSGTVDFDPSPAGIFNMTCDAGATDIFILKLDSLGNFSWAKEFHGTKYSQANSINTDLTGSVYTTGQFKDTVDFDPGSGICQLTSYDYNIFISKLDSTGKFIWAKQMVGPTGSSTSLVLDHYANIYTTGSFQGTVDFDPGPGIYNLSGNGEPLFISKLDSSGNFIWAKRCNVTTSGNDSRSIVLDSLGNIYTVGYFYSTANFDTDSTGIMNVTSNGGSDIFILKLDNFGNFVWVKSFGSSTGEGALCASIDTSGHLYLGGDFISPSFLMGTFALTNADNSNSFQDIFIAKLDTMQIMNTKELINDGDYILFPNPFNDKLTIKNNSMLLSELNLFDLTGRITYNKSFTNSIIINTAPFASGMYFYEIKMADGRSKKGKIIKN